MPLSQPPRDKSGEVIPHDHAEIGSADRIIRRISEQYRVVDQKASSGFRVSSMAFQASTEGNRGMSVDLEPSILEAGLDAPRFVTQPPFIGSVWFEAGYLRSETLQVGYDPLDDNVHHGEVWGNLTRGRRNRLLKTAKWYVEMQGVDLHVI